VFEARRYRKRSGTVVNKRSSRIMNREWSGRVFQRAGSGTLHCCNTGNRKLCMWHRHETSQIYDRDWHTRTL